MHTHTYRPLLLASVLCLLPSGLFAQQLPQPATTATTPNSELGTLNSSTASGDTTATDEVVELSVFNVTGQQDTGYTAMNTASGSRVATPLKDVAASISPFTQEFLDDIGATSIAEIMAFASNVEAEFEDTSAGFGNAASRGASDTDSRWRNRGLPMTRTVDYFATAVPTDNYNIDRVEIASGANAILFGVGNPGGIINFTTARAHTRRNKLTIRNTIGTWTSPAVSGIPLYRATLDHNLVLLPKTLAIRLLSLYQDGGDRAWRKYQTHRDKRITPALMIKPLKNTTINATYETGRRITSTSFDNCNFGDNITGWLDAGSPLVPAFNDSNTPITGLSQINAAASGANPRLTYIPATASLVDLRRTYQTTSRYLRLASNIGTTPLWTAGPDSFYYNPAGPGARREQKFDNLNLSIEQRIGPLNLELAYNHNKTAGTATSPYSNVHVPGGLRADPNACTSAIFTNPIGTNTMPNPHSGGQLYIEQNWFLRADTTKYDTLHLITDYNFTLGQNLGRHRLVTLLEHSRYETTKHTRMEVLVNEENRMFFDNDATNTNNWIYRRQYVTPGDYSTYYTGDPRAPIPTTYFNGHYWRDAYIEKADGDIQHGTINTDSLMIALQSYWLRNRLATIAGIRLDHATSKTENTSTISGPDDPNLATRPTLLIGERYLNGTYRDLPTYHPRTYSLGAVYHATTRLSLSANYSTNHTFPAVAGATVLNPADGTVGLAPLSKGITFDYGIRIDPLANDKIVLTLKHFDSSQDNYVYTTGAAKLASDNRTNIYRALSATHNTPDNPNALATLGVPPSTATTYTNSLCFTQSRGFEAELTANPTKNITLRATLSYTARDRLDIDRDIIAYFNANIPLWMRLATQYDTNPANAGKTVNFTNTNNSQVNLTPNPVAANEINLTEYIRAQLYMPGDNSDGTPGPFNGAPFNEPGAVTSAKQGLLTQYITQNGPLASRPLKMNFSARYTFPNKSPLKGIALMGSLRYQSPNRYASPDRAKYAYDMPPDDFDYQKNGLDFNPDDFNGARGTWKGNTLLFWDAMLRYKRKILQGRCTLTLQFNIQNIFNQNVITTGQTVKDLNDIYTVSRVYLSPPRTLRLMTTLDF